MQKPLFLTWISRFYFWLWLMNFCAMHHFFFKFPSLLKISSWTVWSCCSCNDCNATKNHYNLFFWCVVVITTNKKFWVRFDWCLFCKINNRVRTMCSSWPQSMESFKNCVVQVFIYFVWKKSLWCLQTFHIQYSFSHGKYCVKAFDTNVSTILNGSDLQCKDHNMCLIKWAILPIVLLPVTCSLSQRKVKEIPVSVSLHYMRKTWRNYK